MSLTRDIAARAGAVGWADLPPMVQHAARVCLADGLAIMLGALRHEPAVLPFADHARAYGPGPARLLAGGRAPAPAAAMANGALSHALDFEDTFDAAGLHVNASVIPTVLALAEAGGATPITLAEVLTAMALGADLACRIGLSLPRDPAERGWYHPPMIGALGAALAGARLLGLDTDQTTSALSLTLVQFSLTDALKRAPASGLRALRDGFAARAATEAVLLARAGVIGTPDPIAERGGLVSLLTGAAPAERLFADFGSSFLTPKLTLKLWPCCRGTHGAIALALALRDQGIAARDITAAAFTVAPPDDMLFEPRGDRIRPGSAIAAKFSVPYCFARTMIHGAPGLPAFDSAARAEARTLAMAEAVTMAACAPNAVPSARLTYADGRATDVPLPAPPVLCAGTTELAELRAKMEDCLGPGPALDTALGLETAAPDIPIPSLIARLCPDPAT